LSEVAAAPLDIVYIIY